MNQRLKEIMLAHGLHKNISEDCQHRMEMLAELIAEECAACCGSQADRKNIRKRFGLPVPSDVKYPGEDPLGHESKYPRELNLPK